MSRNQHVVPYEGQWAVRKEGNTRITSVHRTKKDAVDVARESASSGSSEVVIHDRDGKIRSKDSCGRDSILPRYRFVL